MYTQKITVQLSTLPIYWLSISVSGLKLTRPIINIASERYTSDDSAKGSYIKVPNRENLKYEFGDITGEKK